MTIPTLRVFGYESFVTQAGVGLKQMFEKDCQCRVEFFSGPDSGILLQRLKIEGESLGADLIIGLDQFDIMLSDETDGPATSTFSCCSTHTMNIVFPRGRYIPIYDEFHIRYIQSTAADIGRYQNRNAARAKHL